MPAFFAKVWGKKIGAANLGDLVKAIAGHLVVEEEATTIDLFQAGYVYPQAPDGTPGGGVPNTRAGFIKRHPGGKVTVEYANGFNKSSVWPMMAKPLSDNQD